MKNGKNPTRAQRKTIEANKLNPRDWFVVKDMPNELVLISKEKNDENREIQKVISKRK